MKLRNVGLWWRWAALAALFFLEPTQGPEMRFLFWALVAFFGVATGLDLVGLMFWWHQQDRAPDNFEALLQRVLDEGSTTRGPVYWLRVVASLAFSAGCAVQGAPLAGGLIAATVVMLVFVYEPKILHAARQFKAWQDVPSPPAGR